jgi:predicted MFS family arabinose efflux permease
MHGHPLTDTKWVIQSHVAAMFLPSLFIPIISRYINLQGMIIIGVGIYLICITVALIDPSLLGFWSSLVLLGLGWNLLFVAGTSLLPLTHAPEDRFRVQAFNDGFVFSCQALASLSSGFMLSVFGWHSLLLFCLPLCSIPLLTLLMSRRNSRMPLAATS